MGRVALPAGARDKEERWRDEEMKGWRVGGMKGWRDEGKSKRVAWLRGIRLSNFRITPITCLSFAPCFCLCHCFHSSVLSVISPPFVLLLLFCFVLLEKTQQTKAKKKLTREREKSLIGKLNETTERVSNWILTSSQLHRVN